MKDTLIVKSCLFPLLSIGIFFIICSIVGIFLRFYIEKRRVKHYIRLFCECFQASNCAIMLTLQHCLDQYKSCWWAGRERAALKAGLYHLSSSMFKDYDTAFFYIEDYFEHDEIEAMHKNALKTVLEKQTMALPVKSML